MFNLSNLKIGTRLALGFGAVILAGLVVATYGRMSLATINDELNLLTDDRIVKVMQVRDIRDNLNTVARAARNIAFLEDEAALQAEARRIEEAQAKNTELIAKLNASIKSPEGTALLDAVEQVRPAYVEVLAKAVKLGLANENTQARDVLLNELRGPQAAYYEALDDLVAFKQKACQLA